MGNFAGSLKVNFIFISILVTARDVEFVTVWFNIMNCQEVVLKVRVISSKAEDERRNFVRFYLTVCFFFKAKF